MLTEDILLKVRKPARYIGGEINSVVKDGDSVKCKVALCFPDVYDVGMSHFGLKILYSVLNGRADIACERAFAPWHDMEEIMRQKGLALFSLETKRPLAAFDIVGFSLQHELNYTNVLNMLDLGGIPVFSAQRGDSHPLVVGGGPGAFNPEPMADFFDCFVIGDGEEAILEIADAVIEYKEGRGKRSELLRRLSCLDGVYVPSFFKPVKKRLIRDLDEAPFPVRPILPYTEVIHDRIQLEIMRGCRRRCNFCQAQAFYRPDRERSVEKLVSLAKSIYENTGYDEMSLISLSSGDHSRINELIASLKEAFKEKGVSISLPSLRAEDLARRLPAEILSGRRGGLTFAPEVGSDKMRKVINKDVSVEALKECARQAFKNGWRHLKLYFMIGLPAEDYADLDGIVDLAREISGVKTQVDGRPAAINASASVFVPKPHTRFERVGMPPIDEIKRRQDHIKKRAAGSRVRFKFHDARVSYIEAALSRADRKVSASIYEAWRRGCKFDNWSSCFNYDGWMAAFKETGADPDFYALRERTAQEILPWSFIESE